ncbi:MAG: hypothetical protein ACFFDH_25050 [Promethearchaeota archaeon]
MNYDPIDVVYKPGLMKSSGLNKVEFRRVIKEICDTGIRDDETYNRKIDRVVKELRSKNLVHVIYEWGKSRDSKDVLYLKYMKRTGSIK